MKVSGHRIREHVRLLAPLFWFVAAVWLLRMLLAFAHAPAGIVRTVSVTVATSIAVLLATFQIHWRRFGSYPNVVLVSFLLTAWCELLITAAIVAAVLTGVQNIYAAPEYTFPAGDPSQASHIRAHLTFGIGFGTLEGAAVGCLLLWILRMVIPNRPPAGTKSTA